MTNQEIAINVFKGNGFLSNGKNLRYYDEPTIIQKIDINKLYSRIKKNKMFYDICLFNKIIKNYVKEMEEPFVFSEWDNKIIKTPDELEKFLTNNEKFKYTKYA